MKKTLSLLLAVCMLAVMVPASLAFAEDGEQEQQSEAGMTIQEGVPDGWNQDSATGKWMYGKDGNPLVGKQFIKEADAEGFWYFFDAQGLMQEGFQQVDQSGTINFFDKTQGDPRTTKHGRMKTGWLTYNNNKYYLDLTNGARYTGLKTIKGSKYFFNRENGKMKTGWVTDGDETYYFNPKNGRMKTGWLTLKKAKYYLDKKSGKRKTGWVKIDGDKYHFDTKNGKMDTGWFTDPNTKKKYRLDPKTGKMETGFKGINKKKYYFDSNGVMQTGLKTIKGYKYYFNSKGVMQTGAVKIPNKSGLYYFFSSGKAVKSTGWFKGSDKKQRYSLGGGKIENGTRKIGNTWYTFNPTTGVLVSSMDQYDKNMQSKKSSTSYLIQVIKKKHQVRIYKGKKGSWNKIYTFSCSVGASSTPTPEGNFKIYQKLTNNGKHESVNVSGVKVRCWGMCRFWKDPNTGTAYSLNSILYRADTGAVYDSRLGANCTTGTVRLSYNNAMWVWNNMPVNTAVFVVA
ncbi:MAG: L,D-transpeptidase family protein [Eubacterium sp.]|nr:L,D-transpeptidase family protein [Eubacterium sp.]